MSIQLILTHLETLFGKPSDTLMWNNDKLLRLDFNRITTMGAYMHHFFLNFLKNCIFANFWPLNNLKT
jgi:hypothetical protein